MDLYAVHGNVHCKVMKLVEGRGGNRGGRGGCHREKRGRRMHK